MTSRHSDSDRSHGITWTSPQSLTLPTALRASSAFPIASELIDCCVDTRRTTDAPFARRRENGLASIERARRSGHLARITGEIAESIAQILLDGQGYSLFWQITTPGIHGVDLLLLAPDESVLALEVKGTLRAGTLPRLTPSRLRQMSRDWLDDPTNPGMADWSLVADDLYTGVMVVDLALALFRTALSGDFNLYVPVTRLEQFSALRWLDEPRPLRAG